MRCNKFEIKRLILTSKNYTQENTNPTALMRARICDYTIREIS